MELFFFSFFLFFFLVCKISSGEASQGENEPQPGASEEHVASGAAAAGKRDATVRDFNLLDFKCLFTFLTHTPVIEEDMCGMGGKPKQ